MIRWRLSNLLKYKFFSYIYQNPPFHKSSRDDRKSGSNWKRLSERDRRTERRSSPSRKRDYDRHRSDDESKRPKIEQNDDESTDEEALQRRLAHVEAELKNVKKKGGR